MQAAVDPLDFEAKRLGVAGILRLVVKMYVRFPRIVRVSAPATTKLAVGSLSLPA